MTLRRIVFWLTGVALAANAAACGSSPTGPSTAPYKQTDVRVGAGTEATTGLNVTVNYTGWLYDASKFEGKGLQFDTSVGGTPFTFTLGLGQVIRGWDQGIPGMKVGGLRRLIIRRRSPMGLCDSVRFLPTRRSSSTSKSSTSRAPRRSELSPRSPAVSLLPVLCIVSRACGASVSRHAPARLP